MHVLGGGIISYVRLCFFPSVLCLFAIFPRGTLAALGEGSLSLYVSPFFLALCFPFLSEMSVSSLTLPKHFLLLLSSSSLSLIHGLKSSLSLSLSLFLCWHGIEGSSEYTTGNDHSLHFWIFFAFFAIVVVVGHWTDCSIVGHFGPRSFYLSPMHWSAASSQLYIRHDKEATARTKGKRRRVAKFFWGGIHQTLLSHCTHFTSEY
jgi:hypothetical protein